MLPHCGRVDSRYDLFGFTDDPSPPLFEGTLVDIEQFVGFSTRSSVDSLG